jgi:hypothetical protein
MNRFLVVLAPWSSGSSAVTGILERLGGFTCPPHFQTYDPLTPSSFEPAVLRQILLKHIDEHALAIKGNRLRLGVEIQQWLARAVRDAGSDEPPVVVKHPLLSMLVPELSSIIQPLFIVVRRPYADIERTRQRRDWPAIYGRIGAGILYDRIYSDLAALDMAFCDLYFPDLLAHPEREIARLAEYAGLAGDTDKFRDALEFLRR